MTASTEVIARPTRTDGRLTECPNCGGAGLETVYSVKNVTVHSVLLMPTRQDALNYPRADIDLAYCGKCGFGCNALFKPQVHEYSTRYEETQHFSPTFNSFADSLVSMCIERYKLTPKKVILEIGCGKGEFLLRLCERSGCRGIGIDPAYVPHRVKSPALERVQFIQELYKREHGGLMADFICCRHTLEHIGPTYEFLQRVRETIQGRDNVDVFIEVPDATTTVLQPLGFWDVYYEHCSYFSGGSLAHLYRRCGLDITQLERVYGEQYLLIGGRLARGPSTAAWKLEQDRDEQFRHIDRFKRLAPQRIAEWRNAIDDRVRRGKTILIWGGGSKGVAFLQTLGMTEREIPFAVDVNPFKQGMFMPGTGHEVISPQRAAELRPDAVVVMNPIYAKEVARGLADLGLHPEILPLQEADSPPPVT